MKRIVHLGLGNFHRAHQAWYTAQTTDWKITGVVMSNRTLYDQLRDHDNTYLLGVWGTDGLRSETISIYDDVLFAGDEKTTIIKRIADSDTHVVTMTVTEKGYYLSPKGDRLDIQATAIKNDLNAAQPSTAIGLLAAGLIDRARADAGPLTIVSCDNLSDNGRKLRQAVFDYIAMKAPSSLAWVNENLSFPNAMVDRITPRLNDDAIAEIRSTSDVTDLSVVGTEEFNEWVIEDDFAGPRPNWNDAGAVFVDNVTSFEERKLRLLNASHSYLAYAGLLAGHEFVHEAIADPSLFAGVNALWDEAASTVSAPASASLDQYRTALLDRFAVPAMRHQLAQIATDGSIKMRERLVPILTKRNSASQPTEQVKSTLRSWVTFVRKEVADHAKINDPNAAQIEEILSQTAEVSEQDAALMKLIGLQAGL